MAERSKMVITKSEELSNQLQAQSNDLLELKTLVTTMTKAVDDLKTNLTGKIDKLTDTTSTLENRIDKVNTDISNEVKRLETKISSDILELKDRNAQLNDSFNAFKDEQSTNVGELRADFDETKHLVSDHTLVLQTATTQIASQSKKIIALEKECYRGLQHGRGFNIEIDGIPKNVGDDPDQLEEAALKIFDAINVELHDFDIDTIHRLPSKHVPKPTIVRFVTRKSVREIHRNKHKLKDLKDLYIDIAGLKDDSRIFIRASQCSYYKNLAYNCRSLKRAGLISKVLTGKDGRVTIIKNDGNYLQINHESVLTSNFKNFTDFDFEFDDHDDVGGDE